MIGLRLYKVREVQRNFQRAAQQGYDRAAWIQDWAADCLLQSLDISLDMNAHVLEIGCGSGILSRKLMAHWPQINLDCSDISVDMMTVCRHNLPDHCRTFIMDGERLPSDLPYYDYILANLVCHWFAEPWRVLETWRSFVRPGGKIIVTMPTAQTFWQWRDCLRMQGADLTVINDEMPGEEKRLQLQFTSEIEFLRYMRHTGVNAAPFWLQKQGALPYSIIKPALEEFLKQYHGQLDFIIKIIYL